MMLDARDQLIATKTAAQRNDAVSQSRRFLLPLARDLANLVALAETESNSGANRSRAEVPLNVPETAATNRLSLDRATRSSHARLLSPPPLHITKRQDAAVSELPRATAAARLPDGGSSSPVVEPKIASTVVSHGDSLWRISRITYGVGTRYAVVYKANRDRIRDPNRMYPGQIFVLPSKAR